MVVACAVSSVLVRRHCDDHPGPLVDRDRALAGDAARLARPTAARARHADVRVGADDHRCLRGLAGRHRARARRRRTVGAEVLEGLGGEQVSDRGVWRARQIFARNCAELRGGGLRGGGSLEAMDRHLINTCRLCNGSAQIARPRRLQSRVHVLVHDHHETPSAAAKSDRQPAPGRSVG